MRILVVTHYDDASDMMGQPTALIEMPEGKDEQEVFLEYLREKRDEPNLTWKEVEDNDHFLYAWYEWEPRKLKAFK